MKVVERPNHCHPTMQMVVRNPTVCEKPLKLLVPRRDNHRANQRFLAKKDCKGQNSCSQVQLQRLREINPSLKKRRLNGQFAGNLEVLFLKQLSLTGILRDFTWERLETFNTVFLVKHGIMAFALKETTLQQLISSRDDLSSYSINRDWFLGFVKAEGSFVGKAGSQPIFEITQHSSDLFLFYAIQKWIGAGTVRINVRNDGRETVIYTLRGETTTFSFPSSRRASQTHQR